jgi:hypothetical protein
MSIGNLREGEGSCYKKSFLLLLRTLHLIFLVFSSLQYLVKRGELKTKRTVMRNISERGKCSSLW